jgi:hypothetical protein
LAGLSVCYEEVLIISNSNHLFTIVTGESPSMITTVLNELTTDGVGISILSSKEAISMLIKIAKGERWTDIHAWEVRVMLLTGTDLSNESDCLGETLRRVMEAALTANSKSCRTFEEMTHDWLIRHPFFAVFDRSGIPLN